MQAEKRTVEKTIWWSCIAAGVLMQLSIAFPHGRQLALGLVLGGMGCIVIAWGVPRFAHPAVEWLASHRQHYVYPVVWLLMMSGFGFDVLLRPILYADCLAERIEAGSTFELRLATSIRPGWVKKHGEDLLFAAVQPDLRHPLRGYHPEADARNVARLLRLGVYPDNHRWHHSPAEIAKFYERRAVLRALVQGGARLPTR